MKISTYKTMLDKDTMQNILIRENTFEYIGDNNFSQPVKIVDFMKNVFLIDQCAEEYIYLIAFNTKMKLMGVFEVGHGTVDQTLITPREIFVRALLCGATSIVLVHNHPSGVSEPSNEDIRITLRIKKAGDLIGVCLTDHIIIGDDFTSLREINIFDNI